jgi:predicted AlkP superfamily pyrophosphatase or phosphodiesterase
MTGLAPVDHGIVSNRTVARCGGATVFEVLHASGRTSVVAAYHWFRELLTGETFTPTDRHRNLPEAGIVAAHWYYADDYPDSHTFADAEAERIAHRPDLVWIHPMGPDNAGHRHGGDSAEYRYIALVLDGILAVQVPLWHADGYDVLLTSDHGMHADRMHGGAHEVETQVPLVWMPRKDDQRALPQAQTSIRDFVLEHLLGA